MRLLSSLVRVTLVGALVLGLLWLPSQTPTAAAQAPTIDVLPITLSPGGEATLTFKAFCIEYGKTMARSLPAVAGPTTAPITQILRYALSKGYTETNGFQVQLALWRSIGVTRPGSATGIANEIFTQAGQAPPPPAPTGVSLIDALRNGQLRIVSSTWNPGPPAPDSRPWFVTGEIVVRNVTNSDLTVYFPVGIRVDARPAEQDMVLYITNVRVQPTPTPTPTGAPRPTATPTRPPGMPPTGDTPEDSSWLFTALGSVLLGVGLGLALDRRTRRA